VSAQPSLGRRAAAEAIGTFALVFAGCGAMISDTMTGGRVSHPGVALTFGFVVAVMVYALVQMVADTFRFLVPNTRPRTGRYLCPFALGPISAAHFNPAVTLGFAAARRFRWRHVPAYMAAQVSGALLASLLHRLLYGADQAARARYEATMPSVPAGAAIGFGVILTFFLMLVIMAVATDRRVPGAVPGLAIGLTVALCALFGGPATGASMYPARSLAPALMSGGTALAALPLYLGAPPVGAILAAWCYELLRDGALHAQSAPADLEAAMIREPGLSRR
jgi:MIP family channel proteins